MDFNLYRLVFNAPTVYNDPSGLAGVDLAKKIQDTAEFFRDIGNHIKNLPPDTRAKIADLALDIAQLILDIGGIFEPTPFCDLTSGAISVARGDFLGALSSGLSVVPYLGDIAKFGKIGKYIKSAETLLNLARDRAVLSALRPGLTHLYELLKFLPLEKTPKCLDEVVAPLIKLRDELGKLIDPRIILDALPGKIGKTGPIKEVPNVQVLDDLWDLLSCGAGQLDSGTYPGVVKQLPDGTIIRRRLESRSGGPTLDITLPDGTYIKVHIKKQ